MLLVGREFFLVKGGLPALDKDWDDPGTAETGGKAGVEGGASCCCCSIERQCPRHCKVALVVAFKTRRSASELCIPGPGDNIKRLV